MIGQPENTERRPGIDGWALGIFLLALAVRLLHIWLIRESPFFDNLVVDSVDFHARAVAFLRGSWLEEGVFYQAPLYPVFLAGVFKVFGESLLAVRVVQAVLGSATAVLVYLIGMRLGGRGVGKIAGVMAALYALAIHFDAEILRPSLVVFLATLSLHLMLTTPEKGWLRWIAAGLVLGLAAIARPTFLLFIPAAALWALFVSRRARWLAATALAFGAIIPVGVVTAYNFQQSRALVPVSYNGGINYYIGNNADYDETVGIRPGIRWSLLSTEPRVNPVAEPVRWSDYYYHKARHFLQTQPGDFAALQLKKFVLYWNGHEVERNNSFSHVAEYSPFMRFRLTSFRWIAPLALVGLLLAWRRKAPMGLLALYLATQVVTTVAFFVCARYRMAATPALFVLAAFALVTLAREFKENIRAFSTYLVLVLLLGVAVSIDAYGISQKHYSRADYELALILRRDGQTVECLRLLQRSIAARPDDPDPYAQMGLTLMQTGRHADAIPALETAARLEPRYANTWFNLGLCRARADDFDGAAQAQRRALDLSPRHAEAAQELGRALDLAGQHDEAAKAYNVFLQLARNDRQRLIATLGLGLALTNAGQHDAALHYLNTVLESAPNSLEAGLARARALLGLERREEARLQVERLLQAHPDEARVNALIEELNP